MRGAEGLITFEKQHKPAMPSPLQPSDEPEPEIGDGSGGRSSPSPASAVSEELPLPNTPAAAPERNLGIEASKQRRQAAAAMERKRTTSFYGMRRELGDQSAAPAGEGAEQLARSQYKFQNVYHVQASLIFNELDADGDGHLELEEIYELGRTLGVHMSKAELKSAFRQMDTDGDGKVNFRVICLTGSSTAHSCQNTVGGYNAVATPACVLIPNSVSSTPLSVGAGVLALVERLEGD